jgi:CBS domain-containing protein
MTVSAILKQKGHDVVTVDARATLLEACDLLAARRIGAVVVVEGDRQIRGILSERDIVRAVARDGAKGLTAPVDSCMTREVVTCREADTIDRVMQLMTTGRFRHLPVADNGRLIGLISIGDVVKRRIEQVERDAEELRAYITAA